MNTKNVIETLLKTPKRSESKPAAPKPKAPEAPKVKEKGRRTLGNVWAALEAQRVYTGAPSVSKPQAPPANLQGQGSAPALGTEGAWGGSEQ